MRTKQEQGRGGFETNVVYRGGIPKNASYELRVITKDFAGGHGAPAEPFVDVREYWFKDGPTEEPVPTGKGVMIRRGYLVRLLVILLKIVTEDDAVASTELVDECTRIAEYAKR